MTKMGLRFSVLASGSTGNSFYIETDKSRLLVDAGLSGKQMAELCSSIHRDLKDVDGVLVTHEHTDHIKGLGIIARKYKLPIYANEKTWQAMERSIGEVDVAQKFIFPMNTIHIFGDIDVESFGVSHDAIDPMFYVFHHAGQKVALMTDTGYVSERMKSVINGSDAFIFESNHDVDMLRIGNYSWHLKQRILSDVGHISNEDAALAMSDVIGGKTKRIYLAHLSKDNNMKELAHMSVTQTLASKGIIAGEQLEILHTDPKVPTPLAYV